MEEILFVVNYPAGNGLRSADVKILTKTHFVNECGLPTHRRRRYVRVKQANSQFTKSILSVGVAQFRRMFDWMEIEQMQQSGMLDYYPNERYIARKYPMFSAPVYKNFGIKKER